MRAPQWFKEKSSGIWRLAPAKFRWDREGLHIPPGAGVGWTYYAGEIHLMWALIVLFLAYEITEDVRIKDQAYRDILGFVIGFSTVAAVCLTFFN